MFALCNEVCFSSKFSLTNLQNKQYVEIKELFKLNNLFYLTKCLKYKSYILLILMNEKYMQSKTVGLIDSELSVHVY